jgi:hypothetical protein
MKIELPATRQAWAQSECYRPAVLIAWLVARNGALVVRIRQLEEEVEALRQRQPVRLHGTVFSSSGG